MRERLELAMDVRNEHLGTFWQVQYRIEVDDLCRCFCGGWKRFRQQLKVTLLAIIHDVLLLARHS